jgi:hypothetical protein
MQAAAIEVADCTASAAATRCQQRIHSTLHGRSDNVKIIAGVAGSCCNCCSCYGTVMYAQQCTKANVATERN